MNITNFILLLAQESVSLMLKMSWYLLLHLKKKLK
jgi:hypothetical protein